MANVVGCKEGTLISLGTAAGWNPLSLPAAGLYTASFIVDIGTQWGRRWRPYLKFRHSTAPTVGRVHELYAVRSQDAAGTGFRDALTPLGGTSGTGADKAQMQFIGVFVVRAVNTAQNAGCSDLWYPQGRYNTFAIFNDTDQALDGTAGNENLWFQEIVDEIQA